MQSTLPALLAGLVAIAGLSSPLPAHANVDAAPTSLAASGFELDLGGRLFDPLHAAPTSMHGTSAGPDLRLVQFEGPIQPHWLSALAADGIQVLQYLHPYSYVVWADAASFARAQGAPGLRWRGDYLPEYRLAANARGLDAERRQTMAMFSRHTDLAGLTAAIEALGGTIALHDVVDRHFGVIQLDLAGDRLADLAAVPGIYTVQTITPISAEEALRGEMSQQSVVGAYGGAPSYTIVPGYEDWLAGSGYDGSGVVAGIVDGGSLVSHQDLIGRALPCVNAGAAQTTCMSATSAHGTHVAAAVAGTGASGAMRNGFLRGQGVAPGANIISQRYNAFLSSGTGGMVANGMLTIYRESALSGAVLTNNSWGPTTTPQGYDIPTRQIDIIARDALADQPGQQPVLPVWSIMNGNGDSGGACAPASVASPDEAKNLFAVGSTSLQNGSGTQLSTIFNISANSAHGNACDGRRIPHIVAPGCSTDSASNGNTSAYEMMCGTSMASPVVTGAVALFIEQYRAQNEGRTPSPALVKAAFTAVAMNLQGFRDADNRVMGHRPDRFQGYGRLDLDAVINPPQAVHLFDQEEVFTASGQSWTQSFSAADPSQPMRIMLAWTDAPGHGNGGTAPAWVNNLDLKVESGGKAYLGNVIGSDGWSATGGSADERNNLEGVFLSPAQHGGAVTLTVDAFNIAADALNPHSPGAPAQDFAIACYNCLAGPGFALSAEPSALSVCAPDDAFSTITVNAFGGFTDPVTLSASGLPGSVAAWFTPGTVTPTPGSSALVLAGTDTAPAGVYAIQIEGSDGTQTRVTGLTLAISAAAPTAAALVAPAADAVDVSATPTLEWAAVPGALEYRVRLARDAKFEDLLLDETTISTSLVVAPALDTSTTYYWRVDSANACGGEASEVRSFSTLAAPGDCGIGTSPTTLFAEDFSSGLGGFSTTGSSGSSTWTISTSYASPGSGGNAVHAIDLGAVSDQRLVSPVIELPADAQSLSLRFHNRQSMESRSAGGCYDGGILEISSDGGSIWNQVPAAALLTQPYDGAISASSNPLNSRQAWCGDPRAWTLNVVDLAAYAGQSVQLRWRVGSDSSVGRAPDGWTVDDIEVNACGGTPPAAGDDIFADGFEAP